MKKLILTLLASAACSTAFAAVNVENPWARETVKGMSMGGVFMDVKSDIDDVLIGGKTEVADKVEIHTHIHDKATGMMRMREVEGGLTLQKNQTVSLKPGSYHIMLMGLKQQLTPGQKFPLTLKLKSGAEKTITIEVKSNAAASQQSNHLHNSTQHHHHHHHGESQGHGAHAH